MVLASRRWMTDDEGVLGTPRLRFAAYLATAGRTIHARHRVAIALALLKLDMKQRSRTFSATDCTL